jgi:hypothetical protein
MNVAQMFPGYFPPEVLMSAMEGGTAEGLISTYEEDVARAQRVLRQIEMGPEFFLNAPMRPLFPNEDAGYEEDEFGQMVMRTEVPEWMPRPFDGIPVHKAVFEAHMKTQSYELLDSDSKEAEHLYYAALLDIETRNAEREAALQAQMAADQGMANASKPQNGSKPMGSLPALEPTT